MMGCRHVRVLFFLLISSSIFGAVDAIFAATITASEWQSDLDFLAKNLPKAHKNLFFNLRQKDFEAQVRQISESLPAMTDSEVRVALKKLIASVGDLHTGITIGGAWYPIRFHKFSNGLYATSASPSCSRAIGARLVGVGDFRIDEVRNRLLPLVPLENALVEFVFLPSYLASANILCGTHILSGTEEGLFHFEKSGQPFSLTLKSLPSDQQGNFQDFSEGSEYVRPLYLSNLETKYWFRYLADARTLYIQYNSCEEMKSLSFADFTAQALAVADANPVEKVVLDLRHNTGGANFVIKPLLRALKARPALRRKGHLFVLTSHFTMSAALWNALDVRHMGAKMVGEPSAQKPKCYGNVFKFKLPNSGLTVNYPTGRFWFIISLSNPAWILPDVLVETTALDYFSGRDPVLEYVLSRQKQTPCMGGDSPKSYGIKRSRY
jgi:hypothetical protein